MTPYLLLFAYFAIGSVARGRRPRTDLGPWIWIGLLGTVVMIGMRYRVGADWLAYEDYLRMAQVFSFQETMSFGDPGYQLLNWLAAQLGFNVWFVNLLCAIIFGWGLVRFAKVQPDPWLTILVAVPYLIVVVAMGYSRQAVAIGVLLAGLAAVQSGSSIVKFAIYVAIAATFHRTAIAVLPLLILSGRKTTFLNISAGIVGSVLLFSYFLSESVDVYVRNYIATEYASEGAAIRSVMNLSPALAFFLFRKSLGFAPREDKVWLNLSLVAIGLVVVFPFVPSSTAIDRMGLYVIPLQLAILPRLSMLFKNIAIGRLVVIAYSAAVLLVWLFFADHAFAWLPYQFFPMSDL